MSDPKCPHCDHQFDEEEIWYTGSTEFPTEDHCDETETKCSNCEAPLRISLVLHPEWKFLDEDGEEI
jgi:hypothetical protein